MLCTRPDDFPELKPSRQILYPSALLLSRNPGGVYLQQTPVAKNND